MPWPLLFFKYDIQTYLHTGKFVIYQSGQLLRRGYINTIAEPFFYIVDIDSGASIKLTVNDMFVYPDDADKRTTSLICEYVAGKTPPVIEIGTKIDFRITGYNNELARFIIEVIEM